MIGDKATGNIHRLQFLHEQLGGIGNLNMGKVRRIGTAAADPNALLFIDDGYQTTLTTRITQEGIGAFHQTLLRKFGHAMANHRITLHLTESQATLTCSALCWLPREHHEWTGCSGMKLICGTMPETLIIAGTNKDGRFHHASCLAIIHDLIAVGFHSILVS